MSSYTVELNEYLCFLDNYKHPKEDVDTVIDAVIDNFFDFEFSYVSVREKQKLERLILGHFYFREIGFETVALFKNRFKNRFLQIIGNYEQIAKLETGSLFDTVFMQTNGKSMNDSLSYSNGSTNNVNKFSDTPQGGLDGLKSDKYLTNATINENSDSRTGGGNTKSDFSNTTRGRSGDALIERYQKLYNNKMLSVNMLIINELETLFMQIW